MNRKIYDTAIIGAGASGLMAAITAARANMRVVLLEHMDQAGKKLSATGNGKCNYTNLDFTIDNYYCKEPDFVKTVFAQFSYMDTIHFFEELGIRPIQKNGTCIYPESEQASSVKNVLLAEIKRLKIPILYSVGIRRIHKVHNSHVFEILTKEKPFYCKACILATGGMAAKKTGSDGSGYLYARQLGHTIVPPLPALAALVADYSKWKLPAGVRIACGAALYVDEKKSATEHGELQITDYGVSGIVIFQLSRIAAQALESHRKTEVLLDFKPKMAIEELADYLQERFQSKYHAHKSAADCLIGFMPDKIISVMLKRSEIHADRSCVSCSRKQLLRLAQLIKNYKISINGIKGFDLAQATAGGVPVHEIHAESMESKLVSGLYFAGEMIDVDAKCGGYNLQWAWSSGYLAGKRSAAKDDYP